MLRRTSDVSHFPVLIEMLESLGDAARRPAIRALEASELKRARDVYLVECLLDALPEGRDPESAAAVASVIRRCREAMERNGNGALSAICQHARIRAHSILGDMGDRSCLDDLVDLCAAEGPHMRPEVIAALHEIGDRRSLVPLLHSYEAQESGAIREDIRDAFLQIARREGIGFDSPSFADLTASEKAILQKFHPRPRNGNGSNGDGHRPNGVGTPLQG